MKLLLATNNAHKLRELRGILPDWELYGPAQLGLSFAHEETGSSFHENALGKAQTLWELCQRSPGLPSGLLVLADDSGLVVPALGGEPGVYSARYGQVEGQAPMDDRARYRLLLDRMAAVEDRAAHFVCCLALVLGEDRFVSVQESWRGSIAREAQDAGKGFGYDPVFWLEDRQCTVACLPDEEKNRLSHRAKAMARLVPFLRGLD